MIENNNIQELEKVQFINSYYQDVDKYRDVFSSAPEWLIKALDKNIIELIDYNAESMFDYGSYGVIKADKAQIRFERGDWLIKDENGYLGIEKGEVDHDEYLKFIKKWNKIFRNEEGEQK